MKTVVADVFERFLAAFPRGDDASLFADAVSSPDATSIGRAPFWTVLVRGRHQGQEGPHALTLLTVPSRAADAPEVLEFAVRRARANNEARYLLYAHWAGLRAVALPRGPADTRRTVADYEKYLRQLQDQLYQAFLLRTFFDVPTAERLTRAVFDRFGLPGLESIG